MKNNFKIKGYDITLLFSQLLYKLEFKKGYLY